MAFRVAVYTGLLFGSWYFNSLGLPDSFDWSRCDPRLGYLGTESHLVLYRLERPDVHPLHPLFSESPSGPQIYRSQFGAQGIVLSAACRLAAAEPAPFAQWAAAAFALLTAFVAAGVFAAAQRDLGPPVGDVACALAAFVPVFVKFAPSLYWATFLLLLPFALVWCCGPRATSGGRRAALAAVVGVAVYFKALCGYEYVTTVILAPLAASVFHQYRAGESVRRMLWTGIILLGVGLAGLALALATHVVQLEVILGENGVAVIRNRAAARTTGAFGAELSTPDTAGESRLVVAAQCFRDYFGQRALSAPAALGKWARDIPLIAVVAVAGLYAGIAGAVRRRLPREAGALAGSVVIALAAGVSWQVLAVNHMCVHRHLNLIVFAVPFLPLALVSVGYTVRRGGRWIGLVALGLLPVLMVGNVAYSVQGACTEAADQQRAEAAVIEQMARLPTVERSGGTGAVDRVETASAVAPALLVEWGLFDANRGGPADPEAVVMTGWAVSAWRSGPRPSSRVVVVSGGKVVPCQVQWFRRPDLDVLARRPLHRAGFVCVVPSRELVPGERLQVFAVPVSDPTQLAALPKP